MPDLRFTRRGTWWVESSDGRTLQRTGRDTFRFVDGGTAYDIPAEIGGEDGIGIFPSLIRHAGAPAPLTVWQRARELLDASGDDYDPFPDDAVTVEMHERWDDLNDHEGVLSLSSADTGLLPAPVTLARFLAAGEAFWTALRTPARALVRLELELTEAPLLTGGAVWHQDGVRTRASGQLVSPTRLRTATGFILPVDSGRHELPMDEPLTLTGELTVQRLRFVNR